MMKGYLFLLAVTVPFFVARAINAATNQNSGSAHQFLYERGDTLKYDKGTFDDGLAWYTSSGQSDPHEDSIWGTATYFVLSAGGLSNQKLISVSLCWFDAKHPEKNFRLYVWKNKGPGLVPQSEGPHLYRDMNATLETVKLKWKAFDLSAQNIMLPDTFWIGVCGNHFAAIAADADWALAFHKATNDAHTLCNDMDDTKGWFPSSELNFPYAYGVRVFVESATGISEKHLLSYDNKFFSASVLGKGKATVQFTLKKDTKVTLSVHDANGRKCRTLISGYFPSGVYDKSFNLDLLSGMYFLKCTTGYGENSTHKLILFK